jgi:hypothetical protein
MVSLSSADPDLARFLWMSQLLGCRLTGRGGGGVGVMGVGTETNEAGTYNQFSVS